MQFLQTVKARVDALTQKHPDSKYLGLRFDSVPVDLPKSFELKGRTFQLLASQSVIEIREAISREQTERGLVIITDLPDADLGSDVLSVFPKARLLRPSTWEVLLELTGARGVDPRVKKLGWLVDIILSSDRYLAAGSFDLHVISRDFLFGILFKGILGFATPRPSREEVISWASLAANRALFESIFQNVPDEGFDELVSYLRESTGRLAPVLVEMLRCGKGRELLSLSLVAEVLYVEDDVSQNVREATIRFERYFEGIRIDAALGGELFRAGIRSISKLDIDIQRAAKTRAETVMEELRILDLAHRSSVTENGLAMRRSMLGNAIREFIQTRSSQGLKKVSSARRYLITHSWYQKNNDHVERLTMLERIVRWVCLITETPLEKQASSFSDYVSLYSKDIAYADWARGYLELQYGSDSLDRAISELQAVVTELRERFNKQYAENLVRTMPTTSSDSLLLIEDMLDRIVSRAAAFDKILLIVLDGMSFPIFWELAKDIEAREWVSSEGVNFPAVQAVLTAFPSVTNVSRSSLLSGRLVAGNSADEKRNFESNSVLKSGGRKARLFHKAEVASPGGKTVTEEARDAILDPRNPVVSLVINAVDDHLEKGDQLWVQWTLSSVPILMSLLELATRSERTVILTSDHGFVWERGTELNRYEQGERVRLDDGVLNAHEFCLEGKRVLAPENGKMIAPWSENVRYSVRKKNGYHGGITPQETVVPCGVFRLVSNDDEGWEDKPLYEPEWWYESALEGDLSHDELQKETSAAVAKAKEEQILLVPSSEASAEPEVLRPGGAQWLESLISSEQYLSQREMAGRIALTDDEMVLLLSELMQRDGTALFNRICQVFQKTEIRMRGKLRAAARVLNVDGFQVFEFDEQSRTVKLNKALLLQQFGLRP